MYADGAMSELICIQTPPHCSEFVHEGDSLGSPSLYFASALISSFPVSSLPVKTLGLFPIGILAERAVIFLNLRSATCVWPACSCWHGDCYPRLLPIFSNQTSSSDVLAPGCCLRRILNDPGHNSPRFKNGSQSTASCLDAPDVPLAAVFDRVWITPGHNSPSKPQQA